MRPAPTTYEQWRDELEAPAPPTLLDPRVWGRTRGKARRDDDEERRAYHQRNVVIATPGLRQVVHQTRRLRALDRRGRGLLVSGEARTGKTEALLAAGRSFELAYRKRTPRADEDIPVGYTLVPPGANARMFISEVARFFNLDLVGNRVDLMNIVVANMRTLNTQLWLLDEIHNLNFGTARGAEASDQIKYLTERTGITVVIAGIRLDRSGLLRGTRGEQILGRFRSVTLTPFRYGTADDRALWDALVGDLEDALRLYKHKPGTLRRLAPYLHARSAGRIGSLSDLISEAAIAAIDDGTETITRASLDALDCDGLAEASSDTTAASRLPLVGTGTDR